MNIWVTQLTPTEWEQLSEKAHLVTFNTHKPKEWDRISFALMIENEQGPMGYVTCKEIDAQTLYWQYGGSFPGTRDSSLSFAVYRTLVAWCEKNYKRVTTTVENDNFVYLKMAMKVGFKIVGLRVHNGVVLLDHVLEFK